MPQEETVTAFSCLAVKRIISLVTRNQLLAPCGSRWPPSLQVVTWHFRGLQSSVIFMR